MANLMKQTNMTLRERLAHHVGFSVILQARGFTSEPGLLQRVGSQFIKVSNQYFIPSTLHQITLLGFKPNVLGQSVKIRTTIQSGFTGRLVRIGKDFFELRVMHSGSEEWILIPANKVISIEL